MNFQSLKGMIDTLIKSYSCPECNSQVEESNVDIIGAAGTTVNIDILCSKCGKHSMIKTEVLAIHLSNKGISADNLEKLKETLTKGISGITNTVKSIKDEEIVGLNKELNVDKLNVSDLIGE